ncbi:hypothetical protein LCGC14_2932150, partial [marine sediment metagenome]
AIRGKAGPDASHDVQAKNCAEAIRVADVLRRLFPKLELYVPAEHENFVQLAYDGGYLGEREILEIDCLIINNLDRVISYVPEGDELQGGRKIEYDHAVATNKPVCIFHKVEEAADYIEAQYRREQL